MRILSSLILLLICMGCQTDVSSNSMPLALSSKGKGLNNNAPKQEEIFSSGVNDSLLQNLGLIDVQQLNSKIRINIKYATTDNFTKIKLYDRIERAYLQKDVAERLSLCQDLLTSIDTGLYLLIYDAVRPVSVQWEMWRALDSIPASIRGMYVSNPINKSVHNYGAAVDLTICNSNGEALDMGAAFDEFNEIAHPSKEKYFLSIGKLSSEQIGNRNLLRKIMRSQGFRNLPTEWWHFNACSRVDAELKYQLIEEEP